MTYNKQKQSPVAGYGMLCHCGKTRSALRPPSAFKALFVPLDSVGDKDRGGGGAVKALLKTSCVARKCIEEIPNVCKKCHNFSIVSYDGS